MCCGARSGGSRARRGGWVVSTIPRSWVLLFREVPSVLFLFMNDVITGLATLYLRAGCGCPSQRQSADAIRPHHVPLTRNGDAHMARARPRLVVAAQSRMEMVRQERYFWET